MSEFMKKLISALENNPSHVYDFVINHWHEASKEELHRVILELVYAISNQGEDVEAEIMLDMADELSEMYEE